MNSTFQQHNLHIVALNITWRSLHDLIAHNDWQGAIEKLIRSPGSANTRDNAGCLPLHRACEGDAPPELIRALIVASPSTVNNMDTAGRTPLYVVLANWPPNPSPDDYAIIEMLQSDEIEPSQVQQPPQPPQANNSTPGSVFMNAALGSAGQFIGQGVAQCAIAFFLG